MPIPFAMSCIDRCQPDRHSPRGATQGLAYLQPAEGIALLADQLLPLRSLHNGRFGG
jgi:hypothetical protein